MHLGYFGLMGYRQRGKPPHEVFREHIEQVVHADRLGFDIAWFAEHHFSNYCICPSPLIMAARCAGVTKRILLGPAVVVAPLYDPARPLAEIGMVDCLSEGRLVLGVGSGYQPYEFERFGKDSRSAGDFDVPALQGTYFTRKASLK
jgi:alkanesulfonate monooxygenase SsuD/methylene tetrahydromethanopterin reductase-like flavin-dependent oxidoreductase (luciferase family)